MNKHTTVEKLKTLLPPIQHLIDKKAENLDWNENDPNASLILKSSTSGSTNRFKITVDDSGTLAATELT